MSRLVLLLAFVAASQAQSIRVVKFSESNPFQMGEVTSRLQGNKPGMPAEGDFPPASMKVDDNAWAELRSRLERRQAELIKTVASFDADRLDEPVDPKNKGKDGPVTYRALLSGLAQHSAYHAGQIVLLRKGL